MIARSLNGAALGVASFAILVGVAIPMAYTTGDYVEADAARFWISVAVLPVTAVILAWMLWRDGRYWLSWTAFIGLLTLQMSGFSFWLMDRVP